MQLRTHPKMKWEGFSNWPPARGGSYGRGDVFPIGEDGVLTNVEMAEAGQYDATPPDPNDRTPREHFVRGALLR